MKTAAQATLLFAISFFSSSAFTTTVHNFAPSLAMEIELPPKDPQIFVNFLRWEVKGSCEVISTEAENPISFKMLKYQGSLNDVVFNPGESLSIIARPGQQFILKAKSRAEVEVLNEGSVAIKIKCTAI